MFDIVNCNAMIEHLHTSPKKMLLEVLRVLKPGGVLVISNPNIAALHNRIQLLFGGSVHASISDWYHNPAWMRPKYTGHIREYSPRELRYVLQQAGFRNIRATSRSPLPGSKRHEIPSDASLAYSGYFAYLKNSPFYSREFRVRSFYDAAMLINQIATLFLPGARRVAVACGQK
jgi:2-polyprenyl-3-methyl-5-hydroxy-6-metoxy-1,4-benzoquinol methylase